MAVTALLVVAGVSYGVYMSSQRPSAEQILRDYKSLSEQFPTKFDSAATFDTAVRKLSQAASDGEKMGSAELVSTSNLRLGSLYLQSGEPSKAIPPLEKTVSVAPGAFDGDLSKVDTATLQLHLNRQQAVTYLVRAYEAINDYRTARKYAMMMMDQASDAYHRYDAMTELAFCDLHLGNKSTNLMTDEAKELLKNSGAMGGLTSGHASLVKARILAEQGKLREAEDVILHPQVSEPGSAIGRGGNACWYAQYWSKRGDFKKADHYIEEAKRDSMGPGKGRLEHAHRLRQIDMHRENGDETAEALAIAMLFDFYASDDCGEIPLLEVVAMRDRYLELTKGKADETVMRNLNDLLKRKGVSLGRNCYLL